MKVFVYGTLKQGFGNHRLLSDSKFLGIDVLQDHTLIQTPGFPYMVESKGDKARGEVYEVDERIVRYLDALEGYPTHYQKKEVRTEGGREVFTYYLDPEKWDGGLRIQRMIDRYGTGEAWPGPPYQPFRKEL